MGWADDIDAQTTPDTTAADTATVAPKKPGWADAIDAGHVPMQSPGGKTKNIPKNLANHYKDLGFLPMVGSMAGSLMGGGPVTKMLGVPNPVAAAGSGLGAAGGEAVRQVGATVMDAFGGGNFSDLPGGGTSSGPLLAEQGKQAALGFGSEIMGQHGARALGWVGQKAGAMALKAAPEVVQTAIKEGIDASAKGLAKATAKIGELGAHARRIAAQATRHGVRVDIKQHVMDPVLNAFEQKIKGSGVDEVERMAKLEAILGRVARDNAAPVAPTKALSFRQHNDNMAKPIYDAIARKQYVPPMEMEEAQIRKELADRTRELLNGLGPQFKSGGQTMGDVNARNHALIFVKDAVQNVVKPGGGLSEKMLVHGTRIGGIAGAGALYGAFGPGSSHLPGGTFARAGEGALIGGAIAASPSTLMNVARAANSRAAKALVPGLLKVGSHGLYNATQK